MSYAHSHIHVVGVPIKRNHVKMFLLYSGAVLMCLDASVSIFHFEFIAEHMASTSGKFGAAMSGIACFFEKMLEV